MKIIDKHNFLLTANYIRFIRLRISQTVILHGKLENIVNLVLSEFE